MQYNKRFSQRGKLKLLCYYGQTICLVPARELNSAPVLRVRGLIVAALI